MVAPERYLTHTTDLLAAMASMGRVADVAVTLRRSRASSTV
jgi:hypothetical protein